MKGGSLAKTMNKSGFTIIEVMIFLAISGIIFAASINQMISEQKKTEFATGLGSFVSRLQTIANNVNNGYFNFPTTVSCIASSTGPSIGSRASKFSASSSSPINHCIYIGDVISFSSIIGGVQTYNNYPVIGLQYANSSTSSQSIDSSSLATAQPKTSSLLMTSATMPYGLTVSSIKYRNNGGSTSSIGAYGYFTTFNGHANNSTLNSGSQSTTLDPLPSTNTSESNKQIISIINSLTDNCGSPVNSSPVICYQPSSSGPIPSSNIAPINPSSGIQICVNSGTTNQSALLTIGGTNSASTIKTQQYSLKDCK